MALLTALPLLLLGAQNAEATTMIPLSFDQLVDASDEIVRGKVTEIWTEKDENSGMIWTRAQIEVSKTLKGDSSQTVIIIEQPGGKWGTNDAVIESVARFSIGEEGYFFVEHLNSRRSVPVGMFQGKFNIVFNPYTHQEITTRFTVHPRRKFDHRFIPLPPANKRISTTTFENNIIDKKLKGWDGKPIPGTSLQRLQRINTIKKEVK